MTSADRAGVSSGNPADSAAVSAAGGFIEVKRSGSVLVGSMVGSPLGEFIPPMVTDLADLVTRAEADQSIRAVVLTGTHPNRFIAHASIPWLQQGGANMPELHTNTAKLVANAASLARLASPNLVRKTALKDVAQLLLLHDTLLRMNNSGVIFVAALNGSAQGLGSELALACDFRVMAEGDYVLGQFEILLGILPGGGGTQRLPRLIGQRAAFKHILDGRGMTPAEALACGAVDEVVAKEDVVSRSVELAGYYASRDRPAVQAVKHALYFGATMELEDGLATERAAFIELLSSPRAQEVMLAYQQHTAAGGDLPLYDPHAVDEALQRGAFAT